MDEKEMTTNSIFEKKWWLNAVAEDRWEYIRIENKNREIIASFPIYKTRFFLWKALRVPPITQTLGIYIKETGAKLTKRLEREKKLINSIIEKLPDGYQYDFFLDINNQYVLPFIWAGFKVEPMFSYRINEISDLSETWKGFKENIRTDIRKAEKKVSVVEDGDIDILISLQKKTFARQGRKYPYDENLIRKIDKVLCEYNSKLFLHAVDENGNVHAATYFVFDENRCYYLFSGGDPDFRNSGATALLIWKGISYASKRVHVFDFEGSMIEDIERFVRGFGAEPHTYYHVKKLNSFLSFAEYMKPKIKKLLKYK